jgi:transcriptional regulator with XRE-family HTH domain
MIRSSIVLESFHKSRQMSTPRDAGGVDRTDAVDAFVRSVAANIRELRRQARLTLAELASAAGLGKSTLAQLESGRGNPSVETLWAIASALEVPFARIVEEQGPALRVIRAADVPVVHSTETPGWAGRSLAYADRRGTFELYALDLEPGTTRHARAHHAGVTEYLLVISGRLRAGPQSGPVMKLSAGDLLVFTADVPHVYEALEATHCVLVQSYP